MNRGARLRGSDVMTLSLLSKHDDSTILEKRNNDNNYCSMNKECIVDNPTLINKMRQYAINRCKEIEMLEMTTSIEMSNKDNQFDAEDDDIFVDDNDDDDDDDNNNNNNNDNRRREQKQQREQEQECMNLWMKCIELLLSAYTTTNTTDGRRDNDNNGRQLQQQKQPQCRRSSVPMLEVNNQDNNQVKYGILHSIVCCKVPVPTLVEIGCIIFPEQLYQRDLKHKMIPLHHLLKAEHKYEYITSSLLTVLLQWDNNLDKKNTMTSPSPSPTTLSATTTTTTTTTTKMETTRTMSSESESSPSTSTSKPCFYLSNSTSTVLIPFPKQTNNNNNNSNDEDEDLEYKYDYDIDDGPIPLIYALKLGLDMSNVIQKLLNSNTYISLHTIDPITKLYPFQLAAMSTLTISSSSIASSMTSMSSSSSSSSSPSSSSIIPSSIQASSIQALAALAVEENTVITDEIIPVLGQSQYKVDDIYKLLLAHPQVLAEYV